ncbi:MAG: NADPH-dependent oxidoreductase [Chloroflexus sp.]|uniref:NADPH-dependent oxidoreductase n=1 Tax=Chloroflexus sp. TaxID=1904827 RepID=UPI003C70F6D1
MTNSVLTTQELLHQRYGADIPATIISHPVVDLLLSHRSVRSYSNEPLPEGVLETMIAAAQSASTSSNLQTWSVVAVTDPERKDRLATLAGNQNQIRRAPLFLVWLADLARLAHAAETRQMPHEGLDYLEMWLVGVIDAALAAQNAAIAAEALGLGIVYIGAIRNHPLEVAGELQLPPMVMPVFGMCVGWPNPARPAAIKPRLPQAAVLHREVYQPEQIPPAVERYNATMNAFYTAQQMNVEGDWADHSSRRVAGPQSLSGRHVLREVLHRLGFQLK